MRYPASTPAPVSIVTTQNGMGLERCCCENDEDQNFVAWIN